MKINQLKQITSSLGLNRYSNFNKNFFRLLQGNNNIAITGNVESFKIIYKNAVKF